MNKEERMEIRMRKMSDSRKRKGSAKGSKNPNSKIDEALARKIKYDLEIEADSVANIARRYADQGVSYAIVDKIKRGLIWKNVSI